MTESEERTLYIRYRNRGGVIFRINNPQNMIHSGMERIGSVTLRTGEIELLPTASVDDHDLAQIEAWVIKHQALYDQARILDVDDLIDRMNLVTHWYLNEASPDQIRDTADDVLLSLNDLRNSVLRKKSQVDG